MTDYASVADEFFVNLDLQTTLALPDNRETVLHFCEAVQKQFRQMTGLYQRDSGEFVLEGDRTSGSYQWMEMQAHHLSAGYFHPPDLASVYEMHSWLLDRSVYFLGVGGLDVETLDVLFGFNLEYRGNRDAIVSEALLGGSPLSAMLAEHSVRAVEFQPSIVMALTEDCYTQARLSIETRCDSYQVRTGNYEDEPISVYLAVRRYPTPGEVLNVRASFVEQCRIAEELISRGVIQHVLQPIAAAIAAAQ